VGGEIVRIRKVDTQNQMEELIDEYITQGYKVEDRGQATAKLKKVQYGSLVGHILIFIVFGWWTFLLANILYLIYSYMSGEEVLLKIRKVEE
jgi:abortive infection bacteriophage resistance protein